MNPMQLISYIRNGQNPEQLVIQLLEEQIGQTPMGQNLLQLARLGQSAEIEKIARNLMMQQGVDFDTEFANFKKNFDL